MTGPTRIKLLLVDDDQNNLVALSAILDRDYLITTAQSGADAVEIASDPARQIDIVLMDVCLPGISGFEAASRLQAKKETKHIPIIFVTAIATDKKYIDAAYNVGGGRLPHQASGYR